MQEFSQMRTYIKKSAVILLCLALALSLTACKNPKKGDYPATLMIDGTNYYSADNPVSVEVDKDLMKYTTCGRRHSAKRRGGEFQSKCRNSLCRS